MLSNSADKRKPELPRSTSQQGHSQVIFPTFIVKQERKEGRGGEQQRREIVVILPIFPSPLFLLSLNIQGFLTALLITCFNFFLLPQSSDFLGSTKVRETMLMMSAEIIFPQITDMSLEDTSTWLHRLHILLPYVNATVLELLPLSMPCPHYQAV